MPPKDNWVRLNIDRVLQVEDQAGYEGVIRDKYETCLGGLSKCIGQCNIILAKLWGVYKGLIQSFDKGYKNVKLKIDSKEVHAALMTENYKMGAGLGLIRRINSLINQDWEIHLDNLYREK